MRPVCPICHEPYLGVHWLDEEALPIFVHALLTAEDGTVVARGHRLNEEQNEKRIVELELAFKGLKSAPP